MRHHLPKTKLPIQTENLIYDGILEFCKANRIENLARELSRIATVSLFHEHTAKVYAVLVAEYQSTGQISRITGIKSNDVSAVLAKLHKETSLISVVRDGKLKYWKKNENIQRTNTKKIRYT